MKIQINVLYYMLFLVLMSSCKDEKEKTLNEVFIDEVSMDEVSKPGELNKTRNDSYYYGPKAATVYAAPLLGKKIGEINRNDTFNLISYSGKYDYSQPETVKQWLQISFFDATGSKKIGYILDENISFKNTFEYPEISRDTVFVANEKEFLKALASNRVISITAKALDFETYFKTEKNLEVIFNSYHEYIQSLENKVADKQGYAVGKETPFLVFHGYDNLIIKGAKTFTTIKRLYNDEQLSISNCKNLFFDNIIIEGDTSNVVQRGEGFGSYTVVRITNSKAIHFNNFKVNAFNNAATVVKESNGVFFNNSRFNQISNDGIYCINGSNVTIQNSYFVNSKDMGGLVYMDRYDDTDNSSVSITNSLIHNNTLNSIYSTSYGEDIDHSLSFDNVTVKSNYFKNGFMRNVNSSYVNISNSDIEDNKVRSYFFTVVDPKIYIYDTSIIRNTSVDSSYFFNHESGTVGKIHLNNTQIGDNNNFLAFTEGKSSTYSDYMSSDKNSKHFNNYISNTALTEHNKITFEGIDYMYRNSRDIKLNAENNVLYKSKIIEDGYYCLSKDDFRLSASFNSKFEPLALYYLSRCYGKIENGKLTGVWQVVNKEKLPVKVIQEFNYNEGRLEGETKKYIITEKGKTLVEKGAVLDAKKQGEWSYYYPNGNLLRKENYDKGKQTGALTLYYINGKMMDHREHYYYKEGKASFYYPNGQLESEIVYKDKKPVIEDSRFYTSKGKTKKGSLLYTVEEKNGLPYKVDIDLKDKKYKDYNIVKKRSHWGYFQQHSQFKNSKPFGVQRYEDYDNKFERYDYKPGSGDISELFIVELIEDTVLKSNKYVFYDNYDIYQTWLYDASIDKMVLTEYNGAFGLPQLIQHYTQEGEVLVKNGLYQRLNEYGIPMETGYYVNDKKDGDWLHYSTYASDNHELEKKEVYKMDELVSKKRF
ncbi:hypothetical protein [Psychroserpens sp. NJDZ02]|uniref:hypothetical protein n=1 Tax=Psychroserpens sp. NJDZ02 TaxID=2570561 RepID=UPI0010A91A61|nr:hypothetical protein [Psychroserpens sp. NJDZ02]QCE41272.1 hypothetical protein E9099_07545 [Psychroserpens sp. NJDZ02]